MTAAHGADASDIPAPSPRAWSRVEVLAIMRAVIAGYRPLHPGAADPVARCWVTRPVGDGVHADMMFVDQRGQSFAVRHEIGAPPGKRAVEHAAGSVPVVINAALGWPRG